jgi:hypothetical protein
MTPFKNTPPRLSLRALLKGHCHDTRFSTLDFFHQAIPRDPNPNFANDYFDFLSEYEALCETFVARESLFDEKIRG